MIFSAGRAAISSAVRPSGPRVSTASIRAPWVAMACAFGRGWREDQMKALMLENRQIVIDGFNQYQNGGGHCAAPVINGGSVAKSCQEC
jgi:hypothetical protein